MSEVIVLLAIGTLGAYIVVFTVLLRQDIKEIHAMVNSRLSEALGRIDQLDNTLRVAGIDSPKRKHRDRE